MDGPHDLGGRMDFGAVTVDPDEPVFRARWEVAAMAAAPALLSAAPARGWKPDAVLFPVCPEAH
ncbi:hypothetical protein [Streptomyces sp. NPDC048473]|uniref:hypothetical protein n=1 Tax=unclassified Streptomyces TaxID=2593676 RepID=UPI0037130879